MAKENRLVIGLGTGRCGTTSLTAFLNQQESIYMLHEGKYLRSDSHDIFQWSGDTSNVLSYLDSLLTQYSTYDFIGDVGMYFLNYTDSILEHYPQTKFVCMSRSQGEVVKSYMKWTHGRNHWIAHDGTQWTLDPVWDPAYPKFDVNEKEVALQLYWQYYQERVEKLIVEYPDNVALMPLSEFNTKEGKHRLLDFIDYQKERCVDITVRENAQVYVSGSTTKSPFRMMADKIKRLLRQ